MRRSGVVGRCECEWCSGLDELDLERDEARERDRATGAGFAIAGFQLAPLWPSRGLLAV